MYPRPLQKLIDLLVKLPGLGPRQATRLAFFLLKDKSELAQDLASALIEAKEKMAVCEQCFRSMEKRGELICRLCADSQRDSSIIAVVEKESDLQNLEKAGVYHGLYHILGGVISPLDSESPKKLKLKELFERVKKVLEREKKAEVVLATNATTEGDTTALYLERIFAPLQSQHREFKISRLGRGLSLGSELEYVDEMTIKNAFLNRR